MKSRSRKRRRPGPGAAQDPGTPSGVAPFASGPAAPALATAEASDPRSPTDPITLADRWFLPAGLLILLVAAALRLPELALNPFHNDEGVNGFFMMNLVRQGTYTYDPANYHGPSLYYFALLSEVVFGLTTEAMRLVPVVFGILLVALVLPLRRYVGSLATLTAAGLLAVSPGAVYFSRYFIHEMLLVTLSLAVVVAAIFYLDRRQAKYLLACAVALALLSATKETGIITIAVLLIAVVVGHLYVNWRRPPARRPKAGRPAGTRRASVWIDGVEYRPAASADAAEGPAAAWSRAGIPGDDLLAAAVVFGVIYVLLYSSFLTNPKGLLDSVATFTIWVQHGGETQVQPIYQYLQWLIPIGGPPGMIPVEVPIVVLGVIGGLIAAIRAPSRLWVVIGLWAAGITAAYSILQYKTPWIILNMLLPLALLGGLAVQELARSRRFSVAVPVVLVVAALLNGYQAIDLNYNRYDDQAYSYVFVHSTRDMLALVDEIDATAQRAGTGHDTGIVFVTPDYWPLPWYMRDYPKAGFFGKIVQTQEAMIVANVNQEADLELAEWFGGKYERVRAYNLRPGIDLALYVRSDIPKA